MPSSFRFFVCRSLIVATLLVFAVAGCGVPGKSQESTQTPVAAPTPTASPKATISSTATSAPAPSAASGSTVAPKPTATSPATSAPTPSSRAATATGSPSASSVSTACSLPAFKDIYIGFEIGRPAGWTIGYVEGAISVRKDTQGLETALVYPIRLNSGVTADQALSDYVAALSESFAAQGGSLRLSGTDLDGSIKGAPIKGALRTSQVGVDTLIWGGWASAEKWGSEEKTILAVGRCYKKTAGTLLQNGTQVGTDATGDRTTWSYALPDGWKVAGVTSRGIDIMLDQVTGTSFAYLKDTPGNQTPDGFINFLTQALGYSNVSFLGEQNLGSLTDALGFTWVLKAKEYTATEPTLRQQVHGVVTVGVANVNFAGFQSYNAMAALRQARVDQWEALAAISAVVQESIRITDVVAGQGLILPKNNPLDNSATISSYAYKTSVDSRLSAKREEAIMGYQAVRSPTTGQTYNAPLNSYLETGPEGPGYYRPVPNGLEKLTLVNP